MRDEALPLLVCYARTRVEGVSVVSVIEAGAAADEAGKRLKVHPRHSCLRFPVQGNHQPPVSSLVLRLTPAQRQALCSLPFSHSHLLASLCV